MARKRPAPKYAGALAQPIYVDPPGLLELQYPEATLNEKWQTQVPEKMLLLFKHYKIDPSDTQSWQKLAFNLAFEHVPGMQVALRPKRGRDRTWKAELGDELVRAVEDVKSRTGKRTGDAIAELQNEPGGMWKPYTPQSLTTRYWESRARQKALASMSQLLDEINNALGLGRAAGDDQSTPYEK